MTRCSRRTHRAARDGDQVQQTSSSVTAPGARRLCGAAAGARGAVGEGAAQRAQAGPGRVQERNQKPHGPCGSSGSRRRSWRQRPWARRSPSAVQEGGQGRRDGTTAVRLRGRVQAHHMKGAARDSSTAHELHRHPEPSDSADPGRVFKNKRMPGHMGVDRRTVQKPAHHRRDPRKQPLAVGGSSPATEAAGLHPPAREVTRASFHAEG